MISPERSKDQLIGLESLATVTVGLSSEVAACLKLFDMVFRDKDGSGLRAFPRI